MMFTHNFEHPVYSTRWVLSDWFQFLFGGVFCIDVDQESLIYKKMEK